MHYEGSKNGFFIEYRFETFYISYFGFSFNLLIFVVKVEEEQTVKIK